MESRREWNITSVFSVGLICAVLSVIVTKWRRRKWPPGPGSIPILGSVGFFRQFKQKRHHLLTEMEARYGKVFCVRAGSQLVVFLNGNQLVREAFVKQGRVFSDRPSWLPSLQLGLADGKGLVWQDGALVGKVRKFAHKALREYGGVGKASLEQRILRELTEISRHLRRSRQVTLKPLMKKAITNVIHDIVFGERFEYDDAKLIEVVNLLEEFFKGGLFLPKNFLPKLLCKLLPEDEKAYQAKQTVVNKLRQYIYSHIRQHEQRYYDDTDDSDDYNTDDSDDDNYYEVRFNSDVKDFIDLYIQSSRELLQNDGGACLSQGEIFRTIVDLFLAGSETTATALEWSFLFMVKHPQVQEKCFQEIHKVLSQSHSEELQYSDRLHMPFVEATLLEVQRMATIVPVGLPHVNCQEATVGGFTIPAKSIVFANLHSCLMDPAVWERPRDFKPERHLDGNGNVRSNESLIPFSVGPRVCLGETMAKMELFLVFTNLLRQFEFSRPLEDQTDIVESKGPINSSQSFDVIVKERSDCTDG